MALENLHTLLQTAIAERRVVTFTLDGFHRVAEPHDYGLIDGERRLFFFQIGGRSRSRPPIGWRWAKPISKISQLHVLDQHFAGPRPASTGQHMRWDTLFASVSRRDDET